MSNRILVVDDEPDITALVAYHLARGGYRVSTAGTGQEALKAAREERPDVVVLDLMLPGVSGYEVLRELRRHPDTADVGVILLTARREEADRIKGLSLGATTISPSRSPPRSSPSGWPRCFAGSPRPRGPPAPCWSRASRGSTGGRTTRPRAVKRCRSPRPSTSSCSPWWSGGAGCRPGRSCSRRCGTRSPTSRPGPWTCTSSGFAPSWARWAT